MPAVNGKYHTSSIVIITSMPLFFQENEMFSFSLVLFLMFIRGGDNPHSHLD